MTDSLTIAHRLQAPAPAATPGQERARNDVLAAKAATEFEALVLAQFIAPLFASVETPAIAGGGPGQDAFGAMLQEEYAKAIAARGGLGIADAVKSALIDMQAEASVSRDGAGRAIRDEGGQP